MPSIQVQDISLYYEEAGEGPPLLFINGLGMSAGEWRNQVDHFSGKYRTVIFDPRGHGKSDKPEGPYSIPLFASDTAELIRSLGLAPVNIVGLSMGGMIAFQLAVTEPELLRSMVIVNSGPEFILRKARHKIEMAARKCIIRCFGMHVMAKILTTRLFPAPEQAQLRIRTAQCWAKNDKRAYLDALRGIEGWSVSKDLHKISCPTLIVSADRDYTPVAYKEHYTGQIPGARLTVIPDSRHATPLDQPRRFNETVDAFLSQLA